MTHVVTLVTCRRWPDLSSSDRRYAEALRVRNCVVQVAPWNGARTPFINAQAVVLRANWDYHHELAAFTAWLTWLEQGGIPVFNSASLVRWNLDKRYLLALAGAGVLIPATRVVSPEPTAVARAMRAAGWRRAVAKPVIGASGHNVWLIEDGAEATLALLRGLSPSPGEAYLLQEFIPEVQAGELSCVFFDGVFSHAFLRVPSRGEFRVNSQYGGRLMPAYPPATVVRQARAVLDCLPEVPLYARVDGVVRAGQLLVMELELNEPALALDLAPHAAERFATATLRRLQRWWYSKP
ncbi:MAG: glutathione synthetase [Chloroflexota bacterium]